MNVQNLKDNHHKLIAFMESEGYFKKYIDNIKREINRILAKADENGWRSYGDVYQEYAGRLKSPQTLRNKRAYLGLIEHFDVYGQYPNGRRRQKIVNRAKYHMLTDEFKAVIDHYCVIEEKRGKKDTTIYGESHNAATFLFALQEKGIKTLQAITEEAVLSVFIRTDGHLRRSCSYKKNVAAVFKACVPKDPETFERILSFLPLLRETRKNIQYLQPEEITALKQVMADENSSLSLRDKAIGMLVMNTGLRCCDIAGMTLASIDWDNDLILIRQQKTEVPLDLPLTATVGNAVYDYLTLERPETECEYIFITERRPYTRLESWSLGNIAKKLFDTASIRQLDGDRQGFHIFRHRLATALLGNGVARPVISQILGHDSPDSLESYLSADFVHLKECALSIEYFAIDEGVFANA